MARVKLITIIEHNLVEPVMTKPSTRQFFSRASVRLFHLRFSPSLLGQSIDHAPVFIDNT